MNMIHIKQNIVYVRLDLNDELKKRITQKEEIDDLDRNFLKSTYCVWVGVVLRGMIFDFRSNYFKISVRYL